MHTIQPDACFEQGRVAARHGQFGEALGFFLWCFDHGDEVDPAWTGVRGSFLLQEIIWLSDAYPRAREELEVRRDRFAEHVAAGTATPAEVCDFASLNKYLGQASRTVDALGKVAPGTQTWMILGWFCRKTLMTERRYDEIIRIFNADEILESGRKGIEEACDAGLARVLRDRLVMQVADLVEALAGLGRTEDGKRLADSIRRLDRRKSTLTMLCLSAERAGQPALVQYFGGSKKRGS